MRPWRIISRYLIIAVLMALVLFCQNASAEIAAASLVHPYASAPVDNFSHRHLSLLECFIRADKDNKEILAAACNLSLAEAAIVIARALPNPTFNMTYGWGPAWQYIIAGNSQSFGATEELLVAGKRTKRIGLAKSSYLHSALQIEAVRFDVHNRVRRAYAELAAAAAYEALIESQKEIALNLLDLTRKKYEAGKAPGSEVVLARLSVMQFDAQQNQVKGRLVQGSARLAQLIGEIPTRQEIIDVDENALFGLAVPTNSLVPDAAKTVPSLLQLLPLAFNERKDLRASIQEAFVNRKALTLAKSQRIPDPVVGFSYQPTTYKSIQAQYFNPNAANSSSSNSGSGNTPPGKVPYQPGYLLTVANETPIFYQYQGQIEQARASWQQKLKQNESLRAQIANDIVTAYESVQVTRENIRKYKQDLLPAAARVAQISRRGYELGRLELSAAVLAQQQYQQTRSAYFDSVSAYQNAWADLEKAVGVTLKL